jgi:hypothetical protein
MGLPARDALQLVRPHGHGNLRALLGKERNMAHQGQCFCGAVTIEASGDPEGMGYCHCASCRGADKIATFAKTPVSERKSCAICGGHLMTNHPTFGLVDVFAATLPDLTFAPGVHVNYQETVLPMQDGLPKFRDFPAELGGSGEMISE